MGELDFVSTGAVPAVFSQHPGIEQGDDLNAEGGQYGDVGSSEVRGARPKRAARSMITSLGIRNGRTMPEEPGVPSHLDGWAGLSSVRSYVR